MAQKNALKGSTILIICRRLNDVSLLSRIKPKPQYHYIIASDDIRVHESVRQYLWVDDVCWIEQMESFYPVASDVIKITEAINRWLKSLANDQYGINKDLLFWIKHAEGGMTTQRVQDLLLLIRSYLQLFNTYNIARVVLLCGSNTYWEDEVLIQTAHSRNIPIQKVGFLNQTKALIRKSLEYFKYPIKLFSNIYSEFKNNKITYGQHKKNVSYSDNNSEIVFQLCSSADNHVENIVPLMKSLQERGYRPVAVTWKANHGADKVRKEGLDAEELEAYTSDSSFCVALVRLFYTWVRANIRIREFINLPELKYNSVPLYQMLLPSIQYFLVSELPIRYRLDQALKKYFKHHKPFAVKLWGGISLYEGYIAWRNLNSKKRPLIFEYWLGEAIEGQYPPDQIVTDLLLVAGEKQKVYSEKIGYSSDRIVMFGHVRYDHLKVLTKSCRTEMSSSYLKIPPNYDVYVLYDPNVVFRGYLTMQEQSLVISTLLKFAKEHSSVALIIKPHPIHRYGVLEQVIEEYSLHNVFIIDKSTLPYHVLNSADIVITKNSTIGIEAMMFEKPVISCILDKDERWKRIYRDAAEYVRTDGELKELLEKLIENSESYSKWKEDMLKRQKQFLKYYFNEDSKPAAEVAAEAIDMRINPYSANYRSWQ